MAKANVNDKMGEQKGIAPEDLKKRQIWKVGRKYLQVTDVGKQLIHYKTLQNPKHKAGQMRITNIIDVANYLNRLKGELVRADHVERDFLFLPNMDCCAVSRNRSSARKSDIVNEVVARLRGASFGESK